MLLVIDDDHDALSIIKDRLNELGDETVIVCETLEDGLKVIQEVEGITKIYLDVFLPMVDGANSILIVAEAVERLSITPKPMILAMSGDNSKEVRDQAIANGARTFLDKKRLITSQEALRDSYFLEERRTRGEAMNETFREIKARLDRMESTLVFTPDSMSTRLASIEGQMLVIDDRVRDVQDDHKELKDSVEPVVDLVKLLKNFPGGAKVSIPVFLIIFVIASTLVLNVLQVTGVLDNLYGLIHNIVPKPSPKEKQ